MSGVFHAFGDDSYRISNASSSGIVSMKRSMNRNTTGSKSRESKLVILFWRLSRYFRAAVATSPTDVSAIVYGKAIHVIRP